MDDELIESLQDLTDEWEYELVQLDSLRQTCPDLEFECLIRKETLEEIIRKVNFVINEFTVIE